MRYSKSTFFKLFLFAILLLLVSPPMTLEAENAVAVNDAKVHEHSVIVDDIQKKKQKKLSKRKERKLRKWLNSLKKDKKKRNRVLLTLLAGGLTGFLLRRRLKRLQKEPLKMQGDGGNTLGCILAIVLLALCVALVKWLGVDPLLGLALFVVLGLIYFVIKINNS